MSKVTRILKMNRMICCSTKFYLDIVKGGSLWRSGDLIFLRSNFSCWGAELIYVGTWILPSDYHKIQLVVCCLSLWHDLVCLDLLSLILEYTFATERICRYPLIDSLIIQWIHSQWKIVSTVFQEASAAAPIKRRRWSHINFRSLRRHNSWKELG